MARSKTAVAKFMRARSAAFAEFSLDWHARHAADIEGELPPRKRDEFTKAARPLVKKWAKKLKALK